ncbi:YncE family protein [Antrihabitans cavernicola]|uniref:YncE family protein n=1 Tax=Antrihabitans cavernicola TaxID=2495913 RepID=A0A5A7S4V1_9NOCA|nr:hypothetical protein [Spelaeibacter cavernicola]KAA0017018.1 hypothetical protein FOY51_25595 [Spelaeibacter cavernicola]
MKIEWIPRRVSIALAGVVAVVSLVVLVPIAGAGPPVGTQGTGNGLVYVPMYTDGSVQVVDPARHVVVATIPDVGSHPIVLKMLSNKSKLYVGNFGPFTAEIGVIDTASNRLIKKIPTLGAPYAVSQLSADGRFLFVPTALSLVQVIDTATDTIVHTFPIPFAPTHLEVAPDGRSFYVLTALNTIERFDSQTGAPLNLPILVDGIAPGWGAMNRDGSIIYAINFITSNITLIDTRLWRVIDNFVLPLGSSPLSGTLTADDSELWVANVGSNDITVLDAHTGVTRRTIKTQNSPAYVGFSSDGRTAYVSDLGALTNLPTALQILKYDYFYLLPPGGIGYLNSYDTASGAQTGSTQVGGYPVAGVYP